MRLWVPGRSRAVTLALLSSSLLLLVPGGSFGENDEKKQMLPKPKGFVEQFPDHFQQAAAEAEQQPLVSTADEELFSPGESKWPRYLNSYLGTPKWLDLGVAFRARPEILTNPFRKDQAAIERDEQLALRTRARIGLNGNVFRFLYEFQDSRSLGVDEGEFTSSSTVNEADVQQLFVSATFRNLFTTSLRTAVHVGRINMDLGRRRLIARNRYRNTTNAFDGVHGSLKQKGKWSVRAFLVRPTPRTPKENDDLFSGEDTLFWGGHYESTQVPFLRANVYYYGLNDKPPDVSDQRQYSTFGLRLYEPGTLGKIDYEVESAWQFGTKAGQDHFAFLLHGEVGYTIDVKWRPRLVFQYDYASGTRDPFGSQSGTFDSLFGGRRFEYTPTGIFGPFFRSNIISPGVRAIVTPAGSWRLTVKFRAWWLAQSRDEWVGSGLQDPTGQAGNVLGQDLELRAQWRPVPFMSFDAGYDHFFKGPYIQNLAKLPGNPAATDSDFFYAETELRF